jgi:hypothetical protein
MLAIPLQPVPSQNFKVPLNGQYCEINLYTRSTGLFIDLYANGQTIVTGVICLNQTLIVRDAYLGFIGDLAFLDTVSETDPVYTGLGSQYQLLYLLPSELP